MNQNALPPELAGMVGLIIAVACGALLVVLIIYIFYLLTLQKALSRCSPRNRLMEPGLVWLFLIPCFNIIWQFFIAVRVPGSLQNEFRDRNRDDGSDYGRGIAMTQAVIGIINIPLSQGSNVLARQGAAEVGLGLSLISLVLSLISFILFIVFWVKIANYSAMLEMDEGDYRDRRLDDYRDDDDDDYGRGSRRPRGDSPGSDAIKEGDPY
jgi:hypothetical protein